MEWVRWARQEAQGFCKELNKELQELDTVITDMIHNGNGTTTEFVLAPPKDDKLYQKLLQLESTEKYSNQHAVLLSNDERLNMVYMDTVGKGAVTTQVFWAKWRLFHSSPMQIMIEDWE